MDIEKFEKMLEKYLEEANENQKYVKRFFIKNDIDLTTTLVELKFQMKGKGSLIIHTTGEESCNFVDFLNENLALFSSHKVSDKKKLKKFEYRYYTFTDYKKKCTVTVNLSDIKYFEIPFYIEDKQEEDIIEWKILRLR